MFAATLGRFLRAKAGNVSVIFVVGSIPVLGVAGGAMDLSRVSSVRDNLQQAADAAALATVGSTAPAADDRVEEGNSVFGTNFVPRPDLGDPATSIEASDDAALVTASLEVPTGFMHILGVDSITVAVEAEAVVLPGPPACLVALNPDADRALSFRGGVSLTAVDCAVHTNSRSPTALHANGNTEVQASAFCAVGGYDSNNFEPPPLTGCRPVRDPYEALEVPAPGACDFVNVSIRSGTETLQPGTYCGGIEVRTGAAAVLDPGVYVIRDGPFEARSHAAISGEGVTIYLSGAGGEVNLRSHSSIELTAPTAGPYAGIAFAQATADGVGLTSTIAGGAAMTITGVVYLPGQFLDVGGGGDVGVNSQYFALIADTVKLHGNAEFRTTADHEATGMPELSIRTVAGARLTQ